MPRTATVSAPPRLGALTIMAGVPALLQGLRVAAAAIFALATAFALHLDDPTWAAISAVIICRLIPGASLRQGLFCVIGTAIGAMVSVVLTAGFAPDPGCVLLGLAIGCGCCAGLATLLREAAAAARLAGLTMAIIATDAMAAPDQLCIVAVSRAAAIGIGIAAASLVLAVTRIGRTHLRLGAQFSILISETLRGFGATLGAAGGPIPDSRPLRRSLIRRVAALAPLIDPAVRDAKDRRIRQTDLRQAMAGLFGALASWRIVATELSGLAETEARERALQVMARLPPFLRGDVKATGTVAQQAAACRSACVQGARLMLRIETEDVALRLLADATAEALSRLGAACDGLTLLAEPGLAPIKASKRRIEVPDLMPALVDGLRVCAAIGGAALFGAATAWPNGPTIITFTAVTALLLARGVAEGLDAPLGFGLGAVLAAGLAAGVTFAVLPNPEDFASLAWVTAAVLVPLAALSTVPRLTALCGAASVTFLPLLGLGRSLGLDPIAYAHQTLAIMAGCLGGAVLMALLPPVSAQERARRLLDLTLRDLHQLAAARRPMSIAAWQSRVHARLVALPEGAEPLEGARLLAALTIGAQAIHLRGLALRLQGVASATSDAEPALRALAGGDARRCADGLAALDQALQTRQEAAEDPVWRRRRLVRARAAILVLRDTLRLHGNYLAPLAPTDADARL